MKLPPQASIHQAFSADYIMSQMQALLSEKDDIIDKKSDVIAGQKKRIKLLEEYLRLANSKRFGASSEQTPPEQGSLFNEVKVLAEPAQEALPLVDDNETTAKTGRKPFAKHLPRHQVFAY
ncbi:transposase [Pseudoalteromonas mariniglutinosa]